MEDVLEVYTRPHDPRRPQVCLDETSRQLLAEVTAPVPVTPGRPVRQDYEYERRGVCNVFVVCEPLRGWRHVTVSEWRTRIDWAHCIKDLLDVHYPDAERVVLVQDNLNTTPPRRCTRRSSRPRPGGWPTDSRSTTPPSTGAG
jgi:DDE superfamily endonuclease